MQIANSQILEDFQKYVKPFKYDSENYPTIIVPTVKTIKKVETSFCEITLALVVNGGFCENFGLESTNHHLFVYVGSELIKILKVENSGEWVGVKLTDSVANKSYFIDCAYLHQFGKYRNTDLSQFDKFFEILISNDKEKIETFALGHTKSFENDDEIVNLSDFSQADTLHDGNSQNLYKLPNFANGVYLIVI